MNDKKKLVEACADIVREWLLACVGNLKLLETGETVLDYLRRRREEMGIED